MKSEVKDKVDDLIVGLSNHIQKGIENGYLDMEKEIAEPVKALANLVTARAFADKLMPQEEKESSQNEQGTKFCERLQKNIFPIIPPLFSNNKNVTERRIELLHEIFDEKERRRALELVAEDKIKVGEYEEANKVLKSIDDNIIKDLRQQLDELEKV